MTQVELDQVVHVSDLTVPDNLEVLDNPSSSVVSVHEVKIKEEAPAEEELVEGAEEGAEAPEGEKAEDQAEPAEAEAEKK